MTQKKKLHPLAWVFIIAVLLVAVTFLIVYAVGVRYINDETHELKFLGRVKDGVPYSGKVYYYDGRVAELDAETKTLEVEGGEKYVGALSGYLPHGKGTLTKADGTLFEGDFYEGYCTGNATITYSNGDIYIGSVDHETRTGSGKYIKKDGTVYEGSFFEGEKDGFGVTKFPDSSVYIGEYKKGIKDGKGAYLFEGGDIYIGDFKEDKRTGQGIYVWSKSEEYSSEFETLFNVTMTDEFKSGFLAYFEGDFARHFLEANVTEATTQNEFFKGFEAIMLRSQLECYVGEFSENQLSGNGKYRWLSGRVYSGTFENGAIPKEALEPETAENADGE